MTRKLLPTPLNYDAKMLGNQFFSKAAERALLPYATLLYFHQFLTQANKMIRFLLHLFVIVMLTVISQLGGIAWMISLFFKRRLLVFAVAYLAVSASAYLIAPILGREPIPCLSGHPLQMQSKIYCALNRQYVVPELKVALSDLAEKIEDDFPGTTTLVLDANFPFMVGFPLLPHLSHHDGRKADLAYYYGGENGYLPNVTRSPIGYYAFEEGPTDCPDNKITLRWDFTWLQNLWPDHQPEPQRMIAALSWLSLDSRIGKIFIEPHLRERFGVNSSKLRFQGCRAARHDDHIHVQL